MPIGIADGMSAGELAVYLGAAQERERILAQQRIDAIRWEGAQEYDTLVKSGVPAPEAMRRAAGKLFYNDPGAFQRAISSIGQGPGQIFEEGGRQFIMDPNGKIRAVPQRWTGSTTVLGPGNQVYKIPLTPEELATAPRTSTTPAAPPVYPLPGGQGSVMVNPSGQPTRIPAPPTEFVKVADKETGVTRTLTQAEFLLEQAQEKAKPLLDQFRANAAEIAAGEEKAVWDWIPGVETYAQKQARIKEQLKAYDLDEKGEPLPGSKLSVAISATMPAAPVAGAPATAVPAAPPVTPPGQLVSPGMIGGRRPPIRMIRPRPTGPGPVMSVVPPTAPALGSTNAPLTTTLQTRPPAPNVRLGPNEVLRFYRPGNKWVIIDTKANKYLRDATQP